MIPVDFVLTMLTSASTLCALFFGFAAFRRSDKKEIREHGAERAVLASEMGYIKSCLEDLKRKFETQDREQAARHMEIMARLAAVEASAQQAHIRIDKLEKKEEARA